MIVDDLLLPLYRQFAHLHTFEQVIVFPFSGAPVPEEVTDYEAFLRQADPDNFRYAEPGEDDAVSHVLHSRRHRAAQGGGVFAPLHHPAHAGGLPGRLPGLAQHRRFAAGHAHGPCQLLGHTVRSCDAIPDERRSERPLACVVSQPGQSATPDQLAAHLLQTGLAKCQLPDRYEAIAVVPRTSTGKFWKLRLREMFPR